MSRECRGPKVWETRHEALGRGRKGVQRAKPFAGVWGVPTYPLFAAVGGARTKSSNCKN